MISRVKLSIGELVILSPIRGSSVNFILFLFNVYWVTLVLGYCLLLRLILVYF